MTGIKPGQLRDLATIEMDASNDAEQDPQYRQAFLKNVPCSIAVVSGDESFRGRQLEAHLSHVVELHRIEGVKADMRLKVIGGPHKGSYLNIVYVRDMTAEGVPQRMQLYCRAQSL